MNSMQNRQGETEEEHDSMKGLAENGHLSCGLPLNATKPHDAIYKQRLGFGLPQRPMHLLLGDSIAAPLEWPQFAQKNCRLLDQWGQFRCNTGRQTAY